MKTFDLFNPLTSQVLTEHFEKKFGSRLNLEVYTREELEDMRNRLRTAQFQHESASGINELLTNETYQKNQAMLQILNTRIKEMLGEDIKKLKDKMVELSEGKKKGDGNLANNAKPYDKVTKGDVVAGRLGKDEMGGKSKKSSSKKDSKLEELSTQTLSSYVKKRGAQLTGGRDDTKKVKGMNAALRKVKQNSSKKTGNETNESGPDKSKIPAAQRKAKGGDWKMTTKDLENEKTKSPTSSAGLARKKKELGLSMNESQDTFKRNVMVVNESLAILLREDEEGKAKAITAAGDIVNDFTSWMQRVGQYQTKSMIELADAIRADFGVQEMEQFKQAVGPALAATLETLTAQREAISNAVAVLAGEAVPSSEPMGMEPGAEPDMDAELGAAPVEPDSMNEPETGDEFGASDAGASGRELRENKIQKIIESHNLMAKLAK